jgi:hypothetical protein
LETIAISSHRQSSVEFEVQAYARHAHGVLKLGAYSRVDFSATVEGFAGVL